MYGRTKEKSPHWNSVKVICLICGKQVYKRQYSMKSYKKHFCGNDCARKYNRKVKIICKNCKEEFWMSSSYLIIKNRKFCSKKCMYEYKRNNPHLYYTDVSNRPRDEKGSFKQYID